jgi:hypothetical protein
MACQAFFKGNGYTTDNAFSAYYQLMNIKAMANPDICHIYIWN